MRRIILTALAVMLSSGVALADRDRRHDDRYRDRRWHNTSQNYYNHGDRYRDHRDYRARGGYYHWHGDNDRRWSRWDGRWDGVRRPNVRTPIYVSSGDRYYFRGGYYRPYRRPVIQYSYRNYYQRPALIVENYDPVPGYIWIRGEWRWDGYQWQWIPGHYEVDPATYDTYYYDQYQY
jgi:hypothetical protein